MSLTFVILFLTQLIASWIFYKKQNAGAFVGGDISRPKALWLWNSIFSWFFVPIVFLFIPGISTDIKVIIGLHTLIWWIRAPIELIMIYKTYNWSPRYGILHDLIHIMGLMLGFYFLFTKGPFHGVDLVGIAYLCSSVLLISFEAVFAACFLYIRGDIDHKIYFASDDIRWRFVNQSTSLAVGIAMFYNILQISLCLFLDC